MYFIFAALVLCASMAVGIYSGSNKGISERQMLAELEASGDRPTSRSLAYALGVAAQEGARAEGRSIAGKLVVEDALDKVTLSPRERHLFSVLGKDAAGTRLRHALIAGSHADEVPGVELYTKNFLTEMFKNPGAGLGNVRTALDRMPAQEFPLERAALLVSLASNPELQAEAQKIALDELTRNIVEARPDPALAKTQEELDLALSTTPAMLLPITAQSVVLRTATDPSQALSATVDGIVAQPDAGLRSTLVSQFVAQHPTMENQLTQALQARGVSIPAAQTAVPVVPANPAGLVDDSQKGQDGQ